MCFVSDSDNTFQFLIVHIYMSLSFNCKIKCSGNSKKLKVMFESVEKIKNMLWI